VTAARFNFWGFHTKSLDFCRSINLGFFLEVGTASEKPYGLRIPYQSYDIFFDLGDDVGRTRDPNILLNNTFDYANTNGS
jgi:hypothetical protein